MVRRPEMMTNQDENQMNDIQLVGKPDVFKLLYKSDFQTQV